MSAGHISGQPLLKQPGLPASNATPQISRGEPVPIIAVPKESHPGESKSHGSAERVVQLVEHLVRTHKLALEH